MTVSRTELVVDIGMRRVSLSAGAGALFTDCFRSLLVPSAPSLTSPADIVIDDVADGRARVSFLGGQVIDPVDHDTLTRPVLNVLERLALDGSTVAANLHGGALATPGGTGRGARQPLSIGKTSRTAELAARGHTYLTDEMVGIDLDTGTLRAFPRPHSWGPRTSSASPRGSLSANRSSPLVPPEALGAAPPANRRRGPSSSSATGPIRRG